MVDIIILDLEWNGAYSRRIKGYINEIIEFGAVKCDESLREKSYFSCFVKPQVSKRISSTISHLTSITDDNLVDGCSFMQAVSRFRRWAGDALILTWGTSDILTLVENCRYFSGSGEIPFLQYYCDLQRFAEEKMGLGTKEQVGLAKAAELLEIDISGMDHHRALDDSRMTLEILRRIWSREEITPFVEKCNEEFYRRITFKTVYVCDLSSPLVEVKHLRFACPKCGNPSERRTKWALKNKGFRAEFRCKSCGHPFAGRLIIKQKYEGLIVNKKTYPVPEIQAPRKGEPGMAGKLRLEINEGVGVLRFPCFDGIPEVNTAFTTRIGGVSENEFAAMNLGFGRGDSQENVEENYRLFSTAAGFSAENLVAGAQDHHIEIRRVTRAQAGIGIWKEKDMESIDGLCTDEADLPLVIYAADCVPLYFVDEEHHAIGLAHAGWKGTAAGMAMAMVERMTAEFGTNPQKLQVAIGPSICRDCFEVDEPVAEVFAALPGQEHFLSGPAPSPAGDEGQKEPEKYHVDLWECNRQYLLTAGVLPQHIFLGELCTMCESDLVFSHRKTRGRRGSNCAMLALR